MDGGIGASREALLEGGGAQVRRAPPCKKCCFTCSGICLAVCALMTVLGAVGFPLGPVAFIKRDEQLLIEYPAEKYVVNGPGWHVFIPLVATARRRPGIVLQDNDYVIVTHAVEGTMRTVAGPTLFFPDAYETVTKKNAKLVLQQNEYVKVLDKKSGVTRVERGPQVLVPLPTEDVNQKQEGISLLKEEYLRVKDRTTGQETIVRGETMFYPGPHDDVAKKRRGFELKKDEFVRLRDKVTQNITLYRGEQIVFPLATQDDGEALKENAVSLRKDQYVILRNASGDITRVKGPGLVFPEALQHFQQGDGGGFARSGYSLKKDEYVRLRDQNGKIRVEEGEQLVFPEALEVCLDDGIQKAIRVDEETAVMVTSRVTGQRLVTLPGPFIPTPDDETVEERKLIRVDPHAVVIVTAQNGTKKFKMGGEKGSSFFLAPYEEIYSMRWSSGTSEDDLRNGVVNNGGRPMYKVTVSHITMKVQDAEFKYQVQTADNVKLFLEGHISWQITDITQMVANTDDPKGDVWTNTRSVLITVVGQVSLSTFMHSFSALVANASRADAEYYEERGTKVHRVQITGYSCVDQKTEQTLQQVNQETTNKINRMKQQESENEVQQAKLLSQIELERQRADLIIAQAENERKKASVDGEATGVQLALQVNTFMSLLNHSLPALEDRLQMFKLFEQHRAMIENTGKLAESKATLFLTPEDMQVKLFMEQPRNEL